MEPRSLSLLCMLIWASGSSTLGALRANAEYASYGASRASVRQLAQALAREMSAKGVHVAHAIANGRITDADNEDTKTGKSIAAEAVGKTYLWLVSVTSKKHSTKSTLTWKSSLSKTLRSGLMKWTYGLHRKSFELFTV